MSIQTNGEHHKTTSGGNRKNELVQPDDYSDGRTKQCYKDECDISKIMLRAEKAGTLSHLEKFEGIYADFSDYDFVESTTILARGREIFAELPGELRQEFNQDPQQFFEYVNDADNVGKLHELLPALAKAGRQLPVQPIDPATVPIEPAFIPAETTPAATPPAAKPAAAEPTPD